MSSITRMVVCADFGEEEAMARLNAWCAEHDDRQQQFERLDMDAAGGVKVFTGQVWAMAGNYFPYEQLVDAFGSFGWLYPRGVVLVVADEHCHGSEVARAAAIDRNDQDSAQLKQSVLGAVELFDDDPGSADLRAAIRAVLGADRG